MDALAAQIDAALLDARRASRPGAIGDAPDRPGVIVGSPLDDVLVPTAPSPSPTAVAIEGAGFFVVERGGRREYTRLGDFRVAGDGRLIDGEGRAVLGYAPADREGRAPSPIDVREPKGVAIDAKGVVSVQSAHGRVGVARLALAVFPASEHLRRVDPTTLAATSASGAPRFAAAGDANVGTLHDHALENGFVDVDADLERLWLEQRRGESQAAAAAAADSCERDALGLVR